MTNGTIGKWLKVEGDKVTPGEAIAEIETDKATIAYEAQDEFYLAKFIAAPGSEVAVGAPIMVTVEDKTSVAAFANFAVVSSKSSVSAPTPVPVPAPEPAIAAAMSASHAGRQPMIKFLGKR
jgi:pyruvate dehydrogenase E2 component (dihydrolipoamide acetyltransferase)